MLAKLNRLTRCLSNSAFYSWNFQQSLNKWIKQYHTNYLIFNPVFYIYKCPFVCPQLLRRERNPSRVTVIAMAHPRSEMMVSLPSPLKDDPPPPYNACYVPNESSYPPPYNAASPPYTTQPPPYYSVDPLMASCSGTSQAEPLSSSTPAVPATVTVNPTLATPNPVTPNPTTSIAEEVTQDTQEQGPSGEESRSTSEVVGERVPLVVKLPTSQSD